MIKLNFYYFIYLFGNCGESLEQKPKIEFLGRSEFLAEEMRPGKFNCSSIGGIGNRQWDELQSKFRSSIGIVFTTCERNCSSIQ